MDPLVCIAVLNWNGLADTLRCIESLETQTYANRRILVVDNGSTDGSAAALRSLGARIELIENPRNTGYTGGNNIAMRDAFGGGAGYVWLFNNDAVAAPDVLARLVALCERDPAVGLASPLVREADGSGEVQFAAGLFDLAAPSYAPSFDLREGRRWQAELPDRIALAGTALLVRRALFERIGGLDDAIFAYWEDIDYSIRSALAGFRNVMDFDAEISHSGKPAIAAPREVRPHYYYFMCRNELLMWRKHCPRGRFLKASLWVLRRQLAQLLRMAGDDARTDAVLAGLWDGIRGVGGPYDPGRRMPAPLRRLLGRRPGVWIKLLDARR